MDIFTNKTAVVTGAASGIGYALCLRLAQYGAVVYATDVNEAGLQKLAAECAEKHGSTMHTHVLDVSDQQAVDALLQRAKSDTGSLDYVFNNAGIVVGGYFENTPIEVWQKIVGINQWGVVYGTQSAYAIMAAQGHGHIVNTASTAGITPVPYSVAYATTKHAVVGLSTSLREEAKATGVKVSVVLPGVVETGIFDSAISTKGYDYAGAMKKVVVPSITAEKAAGFICKGVQRNKAFITFPLYNRLIVLVYRLFPSLMSAAIGKQSRAANTGSD